MGDDVRVTDELTGLMSRKGFLRDVRKTLDKNSEEKFAIVLLDINRLTMINELFGLAEGDNLLKFVAATLKSVFDGVSNCIVARLHADLFAMLIPFDRDYLEYCINQIESSVKKYSLTLNIDILISYGIYVISDNSMEIEMMRDRAAMALKTVKGNYIQHICYYDESMHDKLILEQEITSNMNSALENREFVVYYQPKHNLDDESIIGAEALVRWNSPTKGMISPGEFIPVFEKNGFIMKLDEYVWEEVCKFIQANMTVGIDLKPISINISRIDVYNPELCDILKNLVTKYNIPCEMLELEFTETAFMDNPQLMLQVMFKLQEYGFKVEIDDFGSGYSSLSMLKDAPVDVLKIDLHFLSKGDNKDRANSIMSAVLRMAKWLGIKSIVEGVETEEQIKFLKSIGCTTVQGFYYARPMSEQMYLEYIQNSSVCKNSVEVISAGTYEGIDVEEFWNTVVEGRNGIASMCDACVLFEVENGVEDNIKLTDSYYKLFNTSRKEVYELRDKGQKQILEEDYPKFMQMFEDAASGAAYGECVYRREVKDLGIKFIYARSILLATTQVSRIYYTVLTDVTKFRK